MDETITDHELRRRLMAFNTKVPPVTGSTRKLLLKKLAKLESGEGDKSSSSKIMPPPKPKTSASSTNESIMISSSVDGAKQSQYLKFNSTSSPRKSARRRIQNTDIYDTSDSEVDAGTLGRSILPANPYIASSSPKSTDTSLMNVSTRTSIVDTNGDQNSYSSSPEIKKTLTRQLEKVPNKLYDTNINKTPTETPVRKLRTSPTSKISSNAELAIQRWREKMSNQPPSEENVANKSLFNSPSPIMKAASQNTRKNIPSVQLRYRKNVAKNTQNIVLLFLGFFALIFGLYFISIQSSTSTLPPGVLNSWCAKKSLVDSKCDVEQEKIQRLFNSLVSQVQDKYIKKHCDNSDLEPSVDAQTVFEFISTHENMPPREIEELIELFKSIAKTYSESPIGFGSSFNINVPPSLPIVCAAVNIFSNMFYLIMWIGIVVLSVVGLYFVICYVSTKSENYKQEVNKLVENTINLLKEQALNRPSESYLPIIHIRDHLIPFDERQAKSKVWAEVVQYFTESESSVRSEVQEIDGEDYQVWRWVQPMSPGV